MTQHTQHDIDPGAAPQTSDHTTPDAPSNDVVLNEQTRLLLERRNLLRVAGMVALAGGGAAALAACAPAQTPTTAPSSAAGSSAPPSSAAPSSAAPSSAAPSSAAPSSAAPSSAAPSSTSSAPVPKGPSVTAADVPVGSGVIMDEPNNYVVTQPAKGQYKAFTAICTHQQCRVTEMRGDKIYCGCHGSEFSISDGAALEGPADEPLEEFKTAVAGGKVMVQA